MLSNDALLYAYEIGFKGESQKSILEWELQEIRQILISKDNFTYTELDDLEAETVSNIYNVILMYNNGQKFAQEKDKK